MKMLPDDAVDRIAEGCRQIGKLCQNNEIQQWEIVATQSYGHSIDIEAGKISLAAGGGEGGYGIRVVEDGRFGYAYLVDIGSADNAIQQARDIAKVSPSVAGFLLPSEQKADKVAGLLDKNILSISPEDLLEQADAILSEVSSLDERAVVTGGGLGVGASAGAIYSSEGIESSGVTTSHGIGVQVSIDADDELTSSFEGDSSRQRLTNVPDCVAVAVDWAQKTRGPIEVNTDAHDTPVLMTSEGFSPLFSMVVPSAIRGDRLVRNESFWSGKQGELVLANDLSLIDDGRLEGGKSASSRDGEGVPTRCQTLVENGRLIGSLWSTRDAAQQVAEGRIEQAESNGCAVRGGHQSPPSTGCADLQMVSSQKSSSQDALLERMQDGYIVHSVMGAHTANPTSGDFSVTSSTLLRVEGGEILGPVKQAGLSGNLAKALSQEVYLGNDVRVQGSYSSGNMHLPDVLLMQGLRINPV
ncbi:MAG: TldD/PmbA family protein [Euryarchaeota archaeon]|jgi:PmbA protein|nr:TldD/PmbA family protein [Euryarchaeota archaeon]MBT6845403.1 TldD/PmbA family protein [Euryarchaeota archaeon]MBT7063174.1 TldD/PmbA family protein [Euryarchaeota archaeon]